MTPERLAEIEAMLEAATPGPWLVTQYRETCTDVWSMTGPDTEHGEPAIIFDCSWVDYEGGGTPPNGPDSTLIASSPFIIRQLLDEIKRLRKATPCVCG